MRGRGAVMTIEGFPSTVGTLQLHIVIIFIGECGALCNYTSLSTQKFLQLFHAVVHYIVENCSQHLYTFSLIHRFVYISICRLFCPLLKILLRSVDLRHHAGVSHIMLLANWYVGSPSGRDRNHNNFLRLIVPPTSSPIATAPKCTHQTSHLVKL